MVWSDDTDSDWRHIASRTNVIVVDPVVQHFGVVARHNLLVRFERVLPSVYLDGRPWALQLLVVYEQVLRLTILLWHDLIQLVCVKVYVAFLVRPLDELQDVLLRLAVVSSRRLGRVSRSPSTTSCTTSVPAEGSYPCGCCRTCAGQTDHSGASNF